jgi:sulfate transport system permease protein
VPLHVEILYNEYEVVAAFSMASILAVLGVLTLAAKTFLEGKVQQAYRETLEPSAAEA